MKEEKLWNALTDIDEDMILEAGQIPDRRIHSNRLALRIALIAAVLSLLSLTVAGLSIGILYYSDTEPETMEMEYYPGFSLSGESYGATVRFDMEPRDIVLPEDWLAALREAWDSFPYEKAYFTGVELREATGERRNFQSLWDLEELLGIPLVSSPELDAATIGVFGELVICDPVEKERKCKEGEDLTPDGILIYVTLDPGELEDRAGRLAEYFTLKLYIPLSRSFCEAYESLTIQPEADGGRFRGTTVNSEGGIQTAVLESIWESTYSQFYSAYGLWEHKGIAYVLETVLALGDPLSEPELLQPYIIRLEEGT